jgi:hypothetical protein
MLNDETVDGHRPFRGDGRSGNKRLRRQQVGYVVAQLAVDDERGVQLDIGQRPTERLQRAVDQGKRLAGQ